VARLDETALAAACSREIGPGELAGLTRLSGGASRETWAFDWRRPDGELALVLRRDPRSAAQVLDRATEYRVLLAAGAAGVPVPEVRFLLTAEDGLGDGFVMDRIEGETIPRKILRDADYAAARTLLAGQCGIALARIHSVDPDAVPGLSGPAEGQHPAAQQIQQYRMILDSLGEAHPAFELGFRWLEEHMPPMPPRCLVHGDFRNGNLIVGPEGIRSVLDWELAHVGDPLEDLGWLCVKSWRFGVVDQPVGGFGSREDLFSAYEEAGGAKVDPDAVLYWEAFGTLKWGVMCMVQAFTHRSGMTRSVELAALGRRTCEMEYDLLDLIAPESREA